MNVVETFDETVMCRLKQSQITMTDRLDFSTF